MKSLFFGLIILMAFTKGDGKMEPVYAFLEKDGTMGKVHPLTLQDMNLHPMQSFWYTESYFFIAYLESGEIAYLNLIVSNMALKRNQPGLTLTIITREGKRLTSERTFAPEELKYEQDRFSIQIGKNFLFGNDQKLTLNIIQADLSLQLEFTSPTAGFKLGDGCAHLGEKKEIVYAINYPAPRARVSGKISYGGKEVPARGWGYIDHCWFNANTTDFEQVWHNLKFFSDDATLIITSFNTPEQYGGKLVGLSALVNDQGVILATTDLMVSEFNRDHDPVGGRSYPKRVVYEFSGTEGGGKIDFDSSHVVEKMDVLEKLDRNAATKVLKWTITQFIAKPFYYRSVGPAELELNLRSKATKLSGRASCEVIFVK